MGRGCGGRAGRPERPPSSSPRATRRQFDQSPRRQTEQPPPRRVGRRRRRRPSRQASPIFALASARELGTLKRIRGTPLSTWIYVTAWIGATILVGLSATALMFIVSVAAFGVHIYPHLLPAAVVTAVLGSASLCAVGIAVSTFVQRADTAPAIANLTLFPLLFLSGSSSRSTGRRTGSSPWQTSFPSSTSSRPSPRASAPTRREAAFPPATSLRSQPGASSAWSSRSAGSVGSRGRRTRPRAAACAGSGASRSEADAM